MLGGWSFWLIDAFGLRVSCETAFALYCLTPRMLTRITQAHCDTSVILTATGLFEVHKRHCVNIYWILGHTGCRAFRERRHFAG